MKLLLFYLFIIFNLILLANTTNTDKTTETTETGSDDTKPLFSNDYYKEEFLKWMKNENKYYTSQEFMKRFDIFSKNVDVVHKWNSEHTSKLGLNQFADLTNEEFKIIFASAKNGIKGGGGLKSSNNNNEINDEDINLLQQKFKL